MKIAVLDDYQQVAFTYADWSTIQSKAEVTVFTDHLSDEADVINRLYPFTIVCAMRERTPLTRFILSQLPNLKLIVSTGKRNAAIDTIACEELGIELRFTDYVESGAPEMTWALIMAMARNIVTESHNFKTGSWQTTIGADLKGKTIGIIGLGRVGQKIAAYAKAFDMKIIAWSENLTTEKAAEHGAVLVSKQSLLQWSDFVTVHLVLSDRSGGVIGAAELALMKPLAYLINTSRGSLVDEAALIAALQNNEIAGAALDVYGTEPLGTEHPLRTLRNVLATPHIGYVTEQTYRVFYGDTVKQIEDWLLSP
ncbi:Lactate dehydrogenase [Mucilaginibacter pineti]|uniref:Lactate dehydrogenase n=1 Tax=Mucilaginibacter pineti TaxID=1391627 RepID=A0A1G7G9B1_9SPHI|nr:D-2-hydroxyacid dehydrogenase family protein [Mucilaginibacter pineti]SDE84710.1 Lactate dehydrogenase [Mucilaginibacter pineti]